ncbi:hypothetical protein F6Y05_32345 [Bacillus megaterium]|nr:hypothetical protein [Priestia megaterium]
MKGLKLAYFEEDTVYILREGQENERSRYECLISRIKINWKKGVSNEKNSLKDGKSIDLSKRGS